MSEVQGSFEFSRFFELPTKADTGTGSVERPCFLSDHIKPPCTEDRGRTGQRVSSNGCEDTSLIRPPPRRTIQ